MELLSSARRRWVALVVVCIGQLMIVVDASIVNVALPAIQHDLHFSQSSLTWVINAYMISYGGFLLLAGRMGDLVGRKRVFLVGLVLFTLASAACGFADSQALLIVARFVLHSRTPTAPAEGTGSPKFLTIPSDGLRWSLTPVRPAHRTNTVGTLLPTWSLTVRPAAKRSISGPNPFACVKSHHT